MPVDDVDDDIEAINKEMADGALTRVRAVVSHHCHHCT